MQCTLPKEVNDVMTPNVLYTFVIYNKHNIRDKLMNSFSFVERDANEIMKDKENDTLIKNISKNELY